MDRRALTPGLVAATLLGWVVANAVLPNGAPLGVILLGLVIGSLDALTALGLVLVYRAARIINFAQAEIGGLAAGVVTVTVAGLDVPYFAALGLGLTTALLTGFLIDATVVRRFFTAPRLILMVATLGVAQVLGALQIALPTWFTDLDLFESVQSPLTASWQVGPVVFTGDHLVAVIMVPIVLIAVRVFLTRSRVGVAIQAAADSNERALLLGIPVRRLSRITWMVSAGLSGIAAMLSAPILGTNLGSIAGPQALLVPIAAAVIARMHGMGVAVGAAIGLGIFRQVFFWNSPRSATVDVAMFAIVLVALLLQRRGAERISGGDLGGYTALREVRPIPRVLAVLPEVRVPRHVLALLGAAVVVVIPAQLSTSQLSFSTTLVILGILAVSLVVLTGWAGQISLGQFALAGIGGAATASVLVEWSGDLFIGLAAATLVAALAAVAVGLPALRIPGMFFAITTLALSVPVATWLLNPTYFEQLTPSSITRPRLLERYELDSPLRWFYLCLAALGVALVVVRRFRATRPGRAVVAARDNERAAAAFSISPNRVRLVAFALSGGLAGLAGGLYVVTLRSVPFNGFSANASIELFTMVVIGGLGSIPGAILGAAYVWSAQFFLQGAAQLLATGFGLLVLLMFVPGGLGQLMFSVRDRYLRWVADRHQVDTTGISGHATFTDNNASSHTPAVASTNGNGLRSSGLLHCRGIDAAYGKVPVLFGVDLDVGHGEVVALLGTNGAGKSTVLRVVAGLLPATAGTVTFDGADITALDPVQRVERGLVTVPGGRGIFGSLTVADNLRVAEWTQHDDRDYLDDTRQRIFELFPSLERLLAEKAASLSGGEQQMLTIAQAMLCRPRLLIIDELSLGLAPTVVANLIEVVGQLAAEGTTMVVVEQSVNVATTLAERAVFMERGEVRFTGPTAELVGRDDLLRSVFFGSALGEPAAPRSMGTPTDTGPALEAVGISMRFGGVSALQEASFSVGANEILGIIGSNGAGKTTLFDVCTGFLAPTSGRIRLAGQDVTVRSASDRAGLGMGRVFQDARLFPGLTVTETIAVALERHIAVRDPIACSLGLGAAERSELAVRDRVDELIETMGLDRYRTAFNSELSTGTRRVVEIACAMAHEPSVLLLDEPSSGIAQRESEALADLLLQLKETTSAAFVVIEHDMPLVTRLSDRLICMHLGSPISEGTADEVLNDPDVVASYLGSNTATIHRSGKAVHR